MSAEELPVAIAEQGDPTRCKILYLASNPTATKKLALADEVREISDKIRAAKHRDAFVLQTRWAVRVDDLIQALNEDRPTIVHFSGHGSGSEGIILHDERGAARSVPADALKALFTTLKDEIRVVVLNACYSTEQASAIVSVIDCVVGMNSTVQDRAAHTFAASFYRALGFGRSVQNAFDQGVLAIRMAKLADAGVPALMVRAGVDPKKVFVVQPQPRQKRRALRYALGVVGIAAVGLIAYGMFRDEDPAKPHHPVSLVEIPSPNVSVDGSDSDLQRAAGCLKNNDSPCVDDAVRNVLDRTAAAPAQMQLRAQAYAIRANKFMQQKTWQRAIADYEAALEAHPKSARAKDWKRGLAAAWANEGVTQLAAGQTQGVFIAGTKFLGLMRELGDDTRLPDVIDYKEFPNGWLTVNAIGENNEAVVEQQDGEPGLRLRCDKGQLIAGMLFQPVDIERRPRLSWRWRADVIPIEGDAASTDKVDQALQVLVLFDNMKMLHYLWDGKAKVGFRWGRPDGGLATLELLLIVLESGTARLRKNDVREERNLVDDYRLFFPDPKEAIPKVMGIGLQTKCSATKSKGDGWVSTLHFLPPAP